MRTFMAKAQDIPRKWYIIDAANKTLGRLASEAAAILRGKHKPIFTPNVDTGDFVIIINAEKIVLTGNKMQDKLYYRHSRYPGGLKVINCAGLMQKKPEMVLEQAIKGMLPHNRLGDAMYGKLKVYKGPQHPHQAQKPEVWELRG